MCHLYANLKRALVSIIYFVHRLTSHCFPENLFEHTPLDNSLVRFSGLHQRAWYQVAFCSVLPWNIHKQFLRPTVQCCRMIKGILPRPGKWRGGRCDQRQDVQIIYNMYGGSYFSCKPSIRKQ